MYRFCMFIMLLCIINILVPYVTFIIVIGRIMVTPSCVWYNILYSQLQLHACVMLHVWYLTCLKSGESNNYMWVYIFTQLNKTHVIRVFLLVERRKLNRKYEYNVVLHVGTWHRVFREYGCALIHSTPRAQTGWLPPTSPLLW